VIANSGRNAQRFQNIDSQCANVGTAFGERLFPKLSNNLSLDSTGAEPYLGDVYVQGMGNSFR
jgi:hypothetical protein